MITIVSQILLLHVSHDVEELDTVGESDEHAGNYGVVLHYAAFLLQYAYIIAFAQLERI